MGVIPMKQFVVEFSRIYPKFKSLCDFVFVGIIPLSCKFGSPSHGWDVVSTDLKFFLRVVK